MCASLRATEQFAQSASPAWADPFADEPAVVRFDRRTDGKGCLVHPHGNIANLERGIHGEAQPHVVDRVPGLDGAAVTIGNGVGLGIAQAGFEVPQAVVTFVGLTDDPTSVHELAFRFWHVTRPVHCALQH